MEHATSHSEVIDEEDEEAEDENTRHKIDGDDANET